MTGGGKNVSTYILCHLSKGAGVKQMFRSIHNRILEVCGKKMLCDNSKEGFREGRQ